MTRAAKRRGIGSRVPARRVDVPQQRSRQVFVSYRREDTNTAADHLYASLSQKLGADKVFRDLVAIQPGEDFPATIETAIRGSTAVLALIGPTWLTVERGGRRRLDDPADHVRREIELALTFSIPLIPVLVGGAAMPKKAQLPPSIAPLANRNAYTLPWEQAIERLSARIGDLERERAAREELERVDRERLDLTHRIGASPRTAGPTRGSLNVVLRTMEMSLAHQGSRLSLDVQDLVSSMTKIFPSFGDDGGFLMEDLIYLIDVVGIKAKNSKNRYVARSYPLRGIDDIASQLELGRPILAGMTAFDTWNLPATVKTGFVDGEKPGKHLVGFVGAVLGWNPFKEQFRVLVPWHRWGEKGIGTLTMKAALASFEIPSLRSIEAVLKPEPSRLSTAVNATPRTTPSPSKLRKTSPRSDRQSRGGVRATGQARRRSSRR